jgi:hypothetical protein
MMNLKPAICLGIALSVSSAWADNIMKLNCELADNEDFDWICLSTEGEDVVFEPNSIADVELNMNGVKFRFKVGVKVLEGSDCLSANPEELKAGTIWRCAWLEKELAVIIPVSDSTNTNLRRQRTRARCGRRNSSCRWRTQYCN